MITKEQIEEQFKAMRNVRSYGLGFVFGEDFPQFASALYASDEFKHLTFSALMAAVVDASTINEKKPVKSQFFCRRNFEDVCCGGVLRRFQMRSEDARRLSVRGDSQRARAERGDLMTAVRRIL